MKKIITFTSDWNAIAQKIKTYLSEKQEVHTFDWINYEYSSFRELAKKYDVKNSQVSLLIEGDVILQVMDGVCDEAMFDAWISELTGAAKSHTVAEIIESTEALIKEDDVIVEAAPAIEEEILDVADLAEDSPTIFVEAIDEDVASVQVEVDPILHTQLTAEPEVQVELEADEDVDVMLKLAQDDDVLTPPITLQRLIDDNEPFVLDSDIMLFDDEFSDEDLGNDTNEDEVDPDDLF